MANVVIGYGATVTLKVGAGAAAAVAEITSIGLPNPQQADVEATHFNSPGRTREYIPGLIDNGEISLGINFDAGSATDTLINSALAAPAAIEVAITVPTKSGTSQKYTFPGVVKGYEKDVPLDDRQTAVLTIRVAGAVVQAATA